MQFVNGTLNECLLRRGVCLKAGFQWCWRRCRSRKSASDLVKVKNLSRKQTPQSIIGTPLYNGHFTRS